MSFSHIIFFYFIVYSFLGWIIEGLFNFFTKKSFIKPNFLYLPFKPMYGIAAVILVLLKDRIPFVPFLICSFIVPSFIEYLTAFLLFQSFHLKYWDYSHTPYNLSGYVCLRFSIYWLFLSLLLVYGVHPFIFLLYQKINWFWLYFFPIMLLIFIIDSFLSIKSKMRSIISSK